MEAACAQPLLLATGLQLRVALARIGAWRSLVAHLLWEQRVGGSNPSAPTSLGRVYSGQIADVLYRTHS
jgi:hypothetical protein